MREHVATSGQDEGNCLAGSKADTRNVLACIHTLGKACRVLLVDVSDCALPTARVDRDGIGIERIVWLPDQTHGLPS